MNGLIKEKTVSKNILVTGFCRGIGRAIAEKFMSEGFVVYGIHSAKSGLCQLTKETTQLKIIKTDLSSIIETRKTIKQLKNIRFDAIVNNAGIIKFEKFDDLNLDNWYEILQVNMNAILEICMGLKDNIVKGGSIVNIASTDGLEGTFASMSYSVSKAGVINLTKSLGNNFGMKGVRVNSISPGWVDTNMTTEASSESVKLTPLGRNAKTTEIANLAYFLTTEKASFINGANIIVDGGYSNVDYLYKKEAEELT
jgi:NAD(P)-dependent dehydrogenase (short-subunit alcohol dehydrogenase family)